MSNIALNRTVVAMLTNKSGGSHALGDVCIISDTDASAVINTTTSGYADGLIAVCLDPGGVADDAVGAYAVAGFVPKVNLSGSASLGDLFKTHTVAKQAVRHAAPIVTGDFGMVLGTGSTPAALLFGSPAGGTSGSSVAEDLTTAETDTSLRLAPDGAGGVEWAAGGGGRTLIDSQTPTGTGVVTFSSIPNTYSKLII